MHHLQQNKKFTLLLDGFNYVYVLKNITLYLM